MIVRCVHLLGSNIPPLMMNIVSIVQLNKVRYKANIDDVVMCILEPGRRLMAKVT